MPGLCKEYTFAAGRRWRFDFAWPAYKLAVEVEGGTNPYWQQRKDGTWVKAQGRHNRAEGFERDAEKYNTAAILGWSVLRFTSGMINDGRAKATVRVWFKKRGMVWAQSSATRTPKTHTSSTRTSSA